MEAKCDRKEGEEVTKWRENVTGKRVKRGQKMVGGGDRNKGEEGTENGGKT